MKTDKASYLTRNSVLELLSDAEVATVSKAETAARLANGEEYLDLDNLGEGVRRSGASDIPAGRVLAKKAVADKTWNKILLQLSAPRFTTGPRRE